jgi:hypothetical protein
MREEDPNQTEITVDAEPDEQIGGDSVPEEFCEHEEL